MQYFLNEQCQHIQIKTGSNLKFVEEIVVVLEYFKNKDIGGMIASCFLVLILSSSRRGPSNPLDILLALKKLAMHSGINLNRSIHVVL